MLTREWQQRSRGSTDEWRERADRVLLALTAAFLRAQPPHPPSWLDLQEGTVSARYRMIGNSLGVRITNQLQDKVTFRARLKPRTTDRVALDLGVFTGNSLIELEQHGTGTGDRAYNLAIKQLYGEAMDVSKCRSAACMPFAAKAPRSPTTTTTCT